MNDIKRATKPERLPVVLTMEEVRQVLECVRLRVNDVDFGYRQITVRDDMADNPPGCVTVRTGWYPSWGARQKQECSSGLCYHSRLLRPLLCPI